MHRLAKMLAVVGLMVGFSALAQGETWSLKAGVLNSSAATGGTAIAPGIGWGGVVGSHIGYEVSYLDGSFGTTGKDRQRALVGNLNFWTHMGWLHPRLMLGGDALWTKTSVGTTWDQTSNFTYGAGIDLEISRDTLLGLQWNQLSKEVSFAGVTLTWK